MNIGHIVVEYNSQDLNSGLTPSSVLFTVQHPREADDTKEERGASCREAVGAEPGRTQWFLPVSAQLCGAWLQIPTCARVFQLCPTLCIPGTAAFPGSWSSGLRPRLLPDAAPREAAGKVCWESSAPMVC